MSVDTLSYEVLSDLTHRELKGAVFILGVKYVLPKDKDSMLDDIRSRIWCSYRRNFRAISGTNLSSDAGWGCTLRCGQMLLAQALLCKKLGREYRWVLGYSNPPYFEILRKFLDVRDSEYSIQMIALQGADFGRSVGQWFGPNNVAQAIKRLAAYDMDSQLAVHVAMDMLVVIEDLKRTALEPHDLPNGTVNVTDEEGKNLDESALRHRAFTDHAAPMTTPTTAPSTSQDRLYSSSLTNDNSLSPLGGRGGVAPPAHHPVATSSPFSHKTTPTVAHTSASSIGVSYPCSPSSKQLVMGDESLDFMKLSFRSPPQTPSRGESVSSPWGTLPMPMPMPSVEVGGDVGGGRRESDCEKRKFRSILLFIPLRLGQDTFNPAYAESLKACLTLPQSVGFIGGKPRHALYFIGWNDNTLLFLDPHTTQPVVSPGKDDKMIPDSSYHTSSFGRMSITGLDPSIALGFFCKDENDLDDLVERLRKVVLKDSSLNMFELTENRPAYWGPFQPGALYTSIKEPFILLNKDQQTVHCDSDDEDFEIVEWPGPEQQTLPFCQAPQYASTGVGNPVLRSQKSRGGPGTTNTTVQ